jgi:hypothetical protein
VARSQAAPTVIRSEAPANAEETARPSADTKQRPGVDATLPNLTSYQPPGWSDKLVLTTTSGSRTDATTFRTTDTVYANFGVINSGGAATTARFYTAVQVDGSTVWNVYTDPPLNANFFTTGTDLSLGTLSAGSHTIKAVFDSTGAIAESNENDNSYSKTIAVTQTSLPNLTSYLPSGWSDKLVLTTTSGSRTDATTFRTTDTVYANFGVINSGGAATTARFYTAVQVDGSTVWNVYTDPPSRRRGCRGRGRCVGRRAPCADHLSLARLRRVVREMDRFRRDR